MLLQLFEPAPYNDLPGINPRPVGRKLYVCAAGPHWWAFLYNVLEAGCQVHGVSASRTPQLGATVQGPCLYCGQPMQLSNYDPGAQGPDDLVHPDCRLMRGGRRG